jgi:hypothetical protein
MVMLPLFSARFVAQWVDRRRREPSPWLHDDERGIAMSDPKRMSPPQTPRMVHEAKLLLVMPGAHALTLELTATILARYGLLDEPATSVVPISRARPIRAAVRRKATALRHEVRELCAQAVVLLQESEALCKPRR